MNLSTDRPFVNFDVGMCLSARSLTRFQSVYCHVVTEDLSFVDTCCNQALELSECWVTEVACLVLSTRAQLNGCADRVADVE